jgi:serine/threonine protein phosphatase PrpC
MIPAISLLAAAVSDTGLVRKNNEDAAYSGHWLYAVADGMGGHAAGEIASAAVIESLRGHDTEVDQEALLETFGRAVTEANAQVARAAAEDAARRGMGTTLTAMLWSSNRFALANIGDSRAFCLREGQFRQITEDHVMGKLVSNAGRLAPVLSRYLDGRPDRSPDLSLHEARPGDRYMICSDGLSPVVGTEAIKTVLSSVAERGEAVRQLVALAKEAGGPDNITAIVLDVREEVGDSATVSPVALGSAASEAVVS